MQRTYSRKGSNRRGRLLAAVNSSDSENSDAPRPQKRQKTEEPPTKSLASSSSSRPPVNPTRLGASRTSISSSIPHRESTTTLGPLVHTDTLPALPIASRASSPSPRKTAKDLSHLFAFVSDAGESSFSSASKAKPASVAKRMLRRTGTDTTASSTVANTSQQSSKAKLPNPSTPQKLSKSLSDSRFDLTRPSTSPRSLPLTPSKSQSIEDVAPLTIHPFARASCSSANVRTYGGKSRSFLVALPAAQFDGLSRNNSQSHGQLDDNDTFITSQEDDLEIRESYADLRERWGVDNSEDDPRPLSPIKASPSDRGKRKAKGKQTEALPPHLPAGMYNDLKSITELRSKGETRRFLDEVGYLFEGLEAAAPLSVRRASALEIVMKLCDAEFARKAKAADFLGRAWDVLHHASAGDKILDTIMVFFAALVSHDRDDLADLAAKSDFVSVIYQHLTCLDNTTDPLWLISCSASDASLRNAGISKAEKIILTNLHKLIQKQSGLLENSDIVSNRVLISIALTTLPPSVHSVEYLSTVLQSLMPELASISSRVSAYCLGLSLLPSLSSISMDTPSLLHVDNCLRLLDSYLLGRWKVANDESQNDELTHKRENGLAEGVLTLCIACDVIIRDTEYIDHSWMAARCLESSLRVLITLTHDDLPWCQAVLSEQASLFFIVRLLFMTQRQSIQLKVDVKLEPEADEDIDIAENKLDDAARSLDRLCLALGLLTNLVQASYEAKERLRDTMLAFGCTGGRGCTRACACTPPRSALECLVFVYTERCKSDDDVDPVIRGHMALLFGLLMEECPENQQLLLRSLPGSSHTRKLNTLIEHAREFSLFYVDFTKKLSAMVDGHSHKETEETDADLETVHGLGNVLQDRRGEAVARDVISFLQNLRDHTP